MVFDPSQADWRLLADVSFVKPWIYALPVDVHNSPIQEESACDVDIALLYTDGSDIFEIPANVAGALFTLEKYSAIYLYRRGAVNRLDDFMKENSGSRILHITGPPGVGKSTCSFALAVDRARQNPEHRVWWFDCKNGRAAIIQNSTVRAWRIPQRFLRSPDWLDETFTDEFDSAATHVFLDQFRKELPMSVSIFMYFRYWAEAADGRVLTVISSDGSASMRDLTDLEVSGNLPRFIMPGWCEGACLLAGASSPYIRARIRENESTDDLTGGPESLEDLRPSLG